MIWGLGLGSHSQSTHTNKFFKIRGEKYQTHNTSHPKNLGLGMFSLSQANKHPGFPQGIQTTYNYCTSTVSIVLFYAESSVLIADISVCEERTFSQVIGKKQYKGHSTSPDPQEVAITWLNDHAGTQDDIVFYKKPLEPSIDQDTSRVFRHCDVTF